MKKFLTLPFILFSVFCFIYPGTNIRISQIDPGRLFLFQSVDCYLSITDALGNPVKDCTHDMFRLEEDYDQEFTAPRSMKKTGFRRGINSEQNIFIMLLLDNSGSMYEPLKTMSGTNVIKIEQARLAVKYLFDNIRLNNKDRLGLAVFNSFFRVLTRPEKNYSGFEPALNNIQKPLEEERATELYYSIVQTTEHLPPAGRKALIVLSDGENFTFKRKTGKSHPEFGDKIFLPADALMAVQKAGISVYAVHFGSGSKKDQSLSAIAVKSGGMVFDAAHEEELKSVYKKIMEQIAAEYLLRCRAGAGAWDKNHVQAVFMPDNSRSEIYRYFSGTVFSRPEALPPAVYLLSALAGIFLLIVLLKIKFENKNILPLLQVLSPAGKVSAQTIVVSPEQVTVIGSSATAALTIAGSPKIKEEHALIAWDEKKSAYTVAGSGDITVNNRPVKTRVLENGDVINIEGTTLVFDQGQLKK